MITRPALCPAGSPCWNKTPKSQLPINGIHHLLFAPHLLASLKAVECSTGPSGRTNIPKSNFASGRTGRTAGLASSTLASYHLEYFSKFSQFFKNFLLKFSEDVASCSLLPKKDLGERPTPVLPVLDPEMLEAKSAYDVQN